MAGIIVALCQGMSAFSYFGYRGYTFYFSVVQLFIVSGMVFWVFVIRHRNSGGTLRSASVIWAILGIGFLFLALDQAFSFHASIASLIAGIFNLDMSEFPEAIEDITVIIFGIIGVTFLFLYNRELKLFREALYLMLVTIILSFGTLFFDALPWQTATFREFAGGDTSWLLVLKDLLTIISEGSLIALGYWCVDIARKL